MLFAAFLLVVMTFTVPGNRRSTVPALLVVLLVAGLIATSASRIDAGFCRTAFLGCRTRAQRMHFCRAACVTTRDLCRTVFRKSGLKRRCEKRALRVCLGEGGSCIHRCDADHPCAAGQQCASGQCIMAEPCVTPCGAQCCGGDYPYCGVNGYCWTGPCSELCGTSCCGGRYPHCGPDARCWTKPCDTLCGNTCCGGDHPVCDGGTCHAGTTPTTLPGGDGFPTNLPPGTYALNVCVSGQVSLCQDIGTLPYQGFDQFRTAVLAAIDQWLRATAATGDCTRGAASYSAFDGSSFTVTATASCGAYSETMTLRVRLV